jgi:integration host factor subunit beta
MLDAKDVDVSVKAVLDAMVVAFATGGRVEIRDFGAFSLNHRQPYIARNPKSGETVQVQAKRVPHFRLGKELRERVDTFHEAPARGC